MRTPLLVIALAACARPAPLQVSTSDATRGQAIVRELKTSLVAALKKSLTAGGPQAIATCNVEAPALALAVSREGAVVGRATRKPRNPSNMASGWQADALSHFEQLRAAGKPLVDQSFLRRLPDGRSAYAEPLVIQALCLACHGTVIAPDVQAAIAERYPADRATGYADGELRGVAWVELPAR